MGLDVELMHRLAVAIDARIEFIPHDGQTVLDELNDGLFDVVIGGLIIKPDRLLYVGFTQPYIDATVAVVVPDHRRGEFRNWSDIAVARGQRFGTLHPDVANAVRRQFPGAEIVTITSVRDYFEGKFPELDGLIIPAEEGAAWNVLYPNHAVVVPDPVVKRPVGMAVRWGENDWQTLLDRWIDCEQQDGSIEQLRTYWIEGGGTKASSPRWSIAHDVLGWLP